MWKVKDSVHKMYNYRLGFTINNALWYKMPCSIDINVHGNDEVEWHSFVYFITISLRT